MNEEIAMRTLAYLITHYKEHDETIINLEEIQAIEFLQQENARLKDKNNKVIKLMNSELTDIGMGECEEVHISFVKHWLKILKEN